MTGILFGAAITPFGAQASGNCLARGDDADARRSIPKATGSPSARRRGAICRAEG
jgi:hypothetical protein